jgi:hypothetical protein
MSAAQRFLVGYDIRSLAIHCHPPILAYLADKHGRSNTAYNTATAILSAYCAEVILKTYGNSLMTVINEHAISVLRICVIALGHSSMLPSITQATVYIIGVLALKKITKQAARYFLNRPFSTAPRLGFDSLALAPAPATAATNSVQYDGSTSHGLSISSLVTKTHPNCRSDGAHS